MSNKPKVLISFREGGNNGGPYNSHLRIMNSLLKNKYQFIPLIIPKGRIGLLNIKLLLHLKQFIKKSDVDIIHFTGLQLEGFYVSLAAKLAGNKNTVLAIHGSSLEAVNFPIWKKFIINFIEIITLRESKFSYGVSNYISTWRRINRYSSNYIGHIYNMYNSNENEKIMKANISFRDEIHVEKDDILIVSTGRITIEKGYEVLANIISNISLPHNVKFIIVGEGDYLNEFKERTKRLTENVIILGYRSDINRILSECDIFILCSLHETLCMSAIEAGYNSLPSVVTNVGGLPEVIDEGNTGFLVDKGNTNGFISALEKLINNADLRKIMGCNAKKHIEIKFSEEKICDQIDQLYRSVLIDDR